MTAAITSLTIEQGATFLRTITIQDATPTAIDITGWSFAAKMGKKTSTSSADKKSFTCTITDAANGVMTISMTSAQTAAIDAGTAESSPRPTKTYVWDLEATKPDGTVIRILEGTVLVSPEVTK